MNKEEKLELLEKADKIVKSEEYKYIREKGLNKIIALSTSNIDPLELKGMLKFINFVDSWSEEYEKEKAKK